MNSIFWFRQDLRTFDNKWLILAIKNSRNLLPIFILDKNLIPDFWNLEDQKFLFLKEMLLNLDSELQKIWWNLTIFHDFPEKIFPEICEKFSIKKIFTNKSYWDYWKKRDEKIKNFCEKSWIEFFQEKDFFLTEPDEIPQRKVFSPFYKLWQKNILEKNNNWEIFLEESRNFSQIKNNFCAKNFLDEKISWEKHPFFTLDFWKSRMKNFDFKNFSEIRNDLDKDWTSRLAPYLRFWVFSVREIYLKVKDISETYVSELAWREFWNHIAFYFPNTKNEEFLEKRRFIEWENNEEKFEKWCNWETWYPVVDAAMKQLLETNWMHWRARMVVASFLTKDLLIDWKWWEKFFKKHLLDYDENVNFWNWQWSASVWADPKPLRIFSPILQSEKFDSEWKFIKKYLPELEFENIKAIHNPLEKDLDYIKTIVDHRIAQRIAKEEYKKSQERFENQK